MLYLREISNVILRFTEVFYVEALAVRGADGDAQVVAMWLHEKSDNTKKAYARDVGKFTAFVGKPLGAVTLGDVQMFSDSLGAGAQATKARAVAAVKSLFAFAHRIGYLRFDVTAPIRLPKIKNALSERILTEGDVHRVIALEENARNRILIKLLYVAGLRVSEACSLRARDVRPASDGGYVTVYGKGGKTRTILLGQGIYEELLSLRGGGPDEPLFKSQKGGALSASQAWRAVRRAAERAGVEAPVSPHWFRHAHASHALDRGCPIHLVQATLGHASVATTGRYLHARPNDSSARYLCSP